jgi:hypothetical protein
MYNLVKLANAAVAVFAFTCWTKHSHDGGGQTMTDMNLPIALNGFPKIFKDQLKLLLKML